MLTQHTSLSYWADATGLDWQNDEIIHLTMTDLFGNIVFSHLFKPIRITDWDPTQQGLNIYPHDVIDQAPLTYYSSTIQNLFNQADLLIGFDNTYFDNLFLQEAGIILPRVPEIDIRQQMTSLFDHNPSIYECADYFNYPLSPTTATYTDYPKAVAYCYHQLLGN